jgi:hypothetical protein
MHSQNISIRGKRVSTFVTEKGDTLVIMNHKDAKVLLEDVLHYEYSDSLLAVYKDRDSLNTNIITFQKEAIVKLAIKETNFETIIANLNKVITNKKTEVALKDETIEAQEKEIKKQKRQKVLAIIGGIALTILTFLATN